MDLDTMAIVYRTQYTLGDRQYGIMFYIWTRVMYLLRKLSTEELLSSCGRTTSLCIFRLNHSSLIGNLGSDYPTHQAVGREFYFPRI